VARVRALLRSSVADRAVFYGMLSQARGLVSGPVTALIVVISLTRPVQGYYYTFAGLVGLQVFLELGFAQVIMQFASHEWAHLELAPDRSIRGLATALARMAGLARLSIRWYTRAGALVWIGLSAAGFAFFSGQHHHGVDWLGPWLIVSFVTAVDFALLPAWGLLQAANQVHAVNFARFISGVLLVPVIWAALLLGAQLWSLALAEVVGLAWDVGYLWRYRRFFGSLRSATTDDTVSWRKEILPVQWRIAVSWTSGYLCFQFFTPAIFAIVGPVAAGQWGMTWSVVGMIEGVAATWIYTKAPVFGSLIARRRYAELDQVARRALLSAIAFAALMSGVALAGIAVLDITGFHYANRLLPVGPAACLFAATIILQISLAQAYYLRAHNAEPFMVLSVLQGAATALATVLLGNLWGTTGVAVGYLVVIAFLVIPMGTVVFLRRRREWHAPPPVAPDALMLANASALGAAHRPD
jgi:O-antigen/teichoic acid export membrane protein